jgi:Fur family transcriptional regulator, stress-responsive regulator
MRKHGGVPFGPDAGDVLRARGLRVTPQRRAILGAFSRDAAEHLSADEIHARASAVVPELGRGTVYAALAELTELGLLAARGSPEPVRYETNTEPHQHFRCRLCLRLFDVELADPAATGLAAAGFVVEQIAITAEGACAECGEYDKGLRAGAKRARRRPSPDLPEAVAATTADTPVGRLMLGATADGVVRSVFEDHGDVPALLRAADGRRGSRAARGHLAAAKEEVAAYFADRPAHACTID